MILECQYCQAFVNAECIEGYDYSYDIPEAGVKNITGKYELWKCPKCERPFLIDADPVGYLVMFLPPDHRVNASFPEPLRLAYTEAISCFNSKAYIATAIMCRKTLEGIYVEHGVSGNNLVKDLA